MHNHDTKSGKQPSNELSRKLPELPENVQQWVQELAVRSQREARSISDPPSTLSDNDSRPGSADEKKLVGVFFME